jgi:hypothetical protein
MALDSQVVPIAFTQGLDTRTQRKLVLPGKWDKLLNLTQAEDDTLQLRDGHAALIEEGNGNGLATYNNELLTIEGRVVSSVSQSTPATRITRDGALPNIFVERSQVTQPVGAVDSQDVAYGDGYVCYVWREYAGILTATTSLYVSVFEEATGAVILNRFQFNSNSTATCPRVVFSQNAFFIFHWWNATLFCSVIQTSAPTTFNSPAALVASAFMSSKNFDVCEFNSEVLVAYVWTDGVTSVRASSVTQAAGTPSIGLTTNVIGEAGVTNASIQALTCQAYGGNANAGVFLVHTAGGALAGGMVGAVLDQAMVLTTVGTLLDATVPPVASACHITACDNGAGSLVVFTDQISSQNTADFRPIRQTQVGSTLVIGSGPSTVANSACFDVAGTRATGPQGPFLYGKAFITGGSLCLPVLVFENQATVGTNTATANAQCSFYLLRVSQTATSPQIAASALYGRVGTINGTGGIIPVTALCSTPVIDDGFRIAVQEFGDAQFTGTAGLVNITPVGLSALTLTPNTTKKPISAQVQGNTFFAGGALGSYDGQRIDPAGFPLFPEGISVVVSAAGTGSMTVGVHQLVAVYAYTDGAGQIQRSAPSPAVSFTVANATDIITVIVPTLQLTSRSDIVIELYMTTAGGLTFYRMLPSYTAIANTLAASTVTVTTAGFTCTDAAIQSGEPLYTQPNQAPTPLPNLYPGPVSALGVSQNRLWYIKADSNEVGFSQEPTPNVGTRFHPSLRVIVPNDGGKPTAVAQLDEKTIIFTERKIYAVFGNGPNINGEFNGYSQPQDIQSDVGCVEPLSVMSDIPAGIFFKSPKGWYLLGRDLSVKYIGDAVARWDSNPVISAVEMGDTQEYRFLLGGTSSDGREGVTLSYSPLTNTWSELWWRSGVGDQYVALSSAYWPAAEDGDGRYVTISAADGLNQDTPGTYEDNVGTQASVGIRMQARTGWLALAKLEGFQRVRELYLTTTSNGTGASLLVVVNYDDIYQDFPFDLGGGAYQFTASLSSAYTASNGHASDMRHTLSRQKCKSVSFSFAQTGSGGGIGATVVTGLQALALEVGIKKGVNKLPAAQTVGP